jgi:putative membrane protein
MKKLMITLACAGLFAGCAQHEEEASVGASGSASSSASGVAGTTEVGGATSGQLEAADAKFVRTAAQSGMMEVRMGQLIKESAQSKGLRDFGDKLVTDHTKANQELNQIASRKGVSPPSQPADKHEKMLDQLSKLKGAEFDRAAQKHAVMHHQEDVQLFEKASQSLQDAELKAFVQKTLPTLKEHLDMAKKLQTEAATGTQPESSGSTSSESSTTSDSDSSKK